MSLFGLGGSAPVSPGTYTVAVKIDTPSKCPEKTLPVTVDACNGNSSISWCMILLITGLVLLLGGSVLFTVGWAFLCAMPCIIGGASFFAVPTGGLSLLIFIFICVFIVVAVVLGELFMMVGAILLLLWLYFCGGCDGVRSPISFYEMLRFCHWFLMWIGGFVFLIDCVILHASGTCATGWLAIVGYLIDAGAIGWANLLVYWFGNAIGCFNSWPSLLRCRGFHPRCTFLAWMNNRSHGRYRDRASHAIVTTANRRLVRIAKQNRRFRVSKTERKERLRLTSWATRECFSSSWSFPCSSFPKPCWRATHSVFASVSRGAGRDVSDARLH